MLIEPHDIMSMGERVALFVDAITIDPATQQFGFLVDWKKARDYFQAKAQSAIAYYYTIDHREDGDQQSFFEALAHEGYVVRPKRIREGREREALSRRRAPSVAVEIALDMLTTIESYDVAILFSGNGNLLRALEICRSRGKRVYVVSTRTSLSSELLLSADKPVFHLEDFQQLLERDVKAHAGVRIGSPEG